VVLRIVSLTLTKVSADAKAAVDSILGA